MGRENGIKHSCDSIRQRKHKKNMTSLYNERITSEYSRKIYTRSRKIISKRTIRAFSNLSAQRTFENTEPYVFSPHNTKWYDPCTTFPKGLNKKNERLKDSTEVKTFTLVVQNVNLEWNYCNQTFYFSFISLVSLIFFRFFPLQIIEFQFKKSKHIIKNQRNRRTLVLAVCSTKRLLNNYKFFFYLLQFLASSTRKAPR